MELRPYQQEAREKIQEEWQEDRKRTLLVLPTGTGKTIVFSKVIEDRVRMGERVLVLAHRGELLDQASDKLEKSTGLKTATEKARSGTNKCRKFLPDRGWFCPDNAARKTSK